MNLRMVPRRAGNHVLDNRFGSTREPIETNNSETMVTFIERYKCSALRRIKVSFHSDHDQARRDSECGEGSAHCLRAAVHASGISATPTSTLVALDGENGAFGVSVASAGDVNGDGYADVAVGASGAGGGAGRAYLYLGSPTGLTLTPATTLDGSDGPRGNFGLVVATAGDVDGDGYADVVVGAYPGAGSQGRGYVYLGGPAGLATTPATSLIDPDPVEANVAVATAYDIDADGYSDLVVGAPGHWTTTGHVYVYRGSRDGLAATPATTLAGPTTGGTFGFSVASAQTSRAPPGQSGA